MVKYSVAEALCVWASRQPQVLSHRSDSFLILGDEIHESSLRRMRAQRSRQSCTESNMKAILISFAVGLLVGVAYALLRVKSPAPPLVALAGLLGMVWGEQLIERFLAQKSADVHISSAQDAATRAIGDTR
jgi:XapX domain-containing protein